MCVYSIFGKHQLRAEIELTSTQDLFLHTIFWHPGQIITFRCKRFQPHFQIEFCWASLGTSLKVSQRFYIQRLGLMEWETKHFQWRVPWISNEPPMEFPSHSKNQGWAISTSFAYNASFTKSANRPRTQLDLEDWLTHSRITVGVFLLVEWNAMLQHAWLRHHKPCIYQGLPSPVNAATRLSDSGVPIQ